MKEKAKRLPEAELEVMLVVWESPQPVSSVEIHSRLQGKRKWALPTLMTVLSRLVEKGYLSCEKQGRNNFYRYGMSLEQYQAQEGRTVLEKLFGNSFPRLVASLYDSKAIGEEELAQLRRFLDELENE